MSTSNKTEPRPASYRTIKIRNDTYAKLQVIQAQVAGSGWSVVGSKRQDAATQGSIIDVALDMMAVKIKAKKK